MPSCVRVLFLSYHFPPIGGAGAQRPARFVRHLRDHRYEPIVVTGPGPNDDRWSPEDASLAAEVPEDVRVVRVPGPEPMMASRARRWLGLPSPWTRWWTQGLVEAGLAAGGDADLVYCWMQPYESAQGAMRLARQLRKPLVADLGDPWALDEMMVFVTRAHRRLELARMRAYFRAASAVVMSTREAAARALERFPELHAKPMAVIPNGYDAADFVGPPPQRDDDAFRIVHTGYLHTEFGLLQRRAGHVRRALGGTVPGLDILTRSHVYLLEAVDRVLADDPSLASKLEVHLAGVLTPADVEVANRSSAVRTYGYVPHSETVGLIRSADLLFLPMQNLPPGVRATIVPGKTYEYLASERPILAAVPDGDAREILAEAGSALLCRPDDVTAMAEAIARQLAARRAGRPSLPPRREVVARYEYGHLAARLADVFASVAPRPAQVACAASS